MSVLFPSTRDKNSVGSVNFFPVWLLLFALALNVTLGERHIAQACNLDNSGGPILHLNLSWKSWGDKKALICSKSEEVYISVVTNYKSDYSELNFFYNVFLGQVIRKSWGYLQQCAEIFNSFNCVCSLVTTSLEVISFNVPDMRACVGLICILAATFAFSVSKYLYLIWYYPNIKMWWVFCVWCNWCSLFSPGG